ncbi:polysaccharide lyase 8 family protein [Neobacillus niacini]|uniref:polysaccharide lyase 8 family protein n=1 Tax=Neobacillus niacini TaxID=86668 RepID=UPI003982E8E0
MEKKTIKILASSLTLSTMLSMPMISSTSMAHASQTSASSALTSTETTNSDTENQFEILMQNYKEYLVGNESINSNQVLDIKINKVHSDAANVLKKFLPVDQRVNGEEKLLFSGLPLGTSDSNLNSSYLNLYQMALAAKTLKREGLTGENLYQDEETIAKVIDGLDWLYTNFFKDQEKGYYGNWYNWEIGMPTNITKTMLLLHDEINAAKPELIENYVNSMDLYLRNGKNGDVDLDSRFHTGANLSDITTNRIIQGAITGDDARISKAVENTLTVFKTIDPNNIVNGNTDGFYEDGSFIQHDRVAYTGSYGRVLLGRMIQTMKILDGSQYNPEEILVPTVKNWIYNGFSPIMFEGYNMEIVKGRAVSRSSGSGYGDATSVLEAMVDLTKYLTDDDSIKLKSHLKYIVDKSKAAVSTSSFISYDAIVNFNNIISDSKIIANNGIDSNGHHAFNLMDKTVHLRDSYGFAFSRSSNRIAKYEFMSGENLKPWFQGDGAFYLYLSGRDQRKQFGVNYFATISPYQYPGTTVPEEERKTIPELYGKQWYENTAHPLNFYSSSESQNHYVYFPTGTNTFSGGVKLGKYGAAGMQLGDEVGYQDKQAGLLPDDFVVYKNADANKSAFMFDDEIVLLGSGIKDQLGRKVNTTLDNRMFETTETSTITGETNDNQRLNNPANGDYHLKWINFNTDTPGTQIGYYFPESSAIKVSTNTVTNSLRNIRTPNPDTFVTRNFFTLGMNHGVNPQNSKYAYVILPNFGAEETKEYAENPSIKILANTEAVHGVENTKLGIKGFNFFSGKRTKVSNVTSFNQASILVKTDGDTMTIAVSDPTMSLEKMKLSVEVPNPSVITASEGVKTSVSRKKALIHINSAKSNGKSFEIKLKMN